MHMLLQLHTERLTRCWCCWYCCLGGSPQHTHTHNIEPISGAANRPVQVQPGREGTRARPYRAVASHAALLAEQIVAQQAAGKGALHRRAWDARGEVTDVRYGTPYRARRQGGIVADWKVPKDGATSKEACFQFFVGEQAKGGVA
jgi:hypothetical protein